MATDRTTGYAHSHADETSAATLLTDDDREVAHALRCYLDEHNISARQASRDTGYSDRTIRRWIHEQSPVPLAAARRLYLAYKDPHLLRVLLDGDDLGITISDTPYEPAGVDVNVEAVRLGAADGKVLGAIADALEDGEIDAAELSTIERESQALQRQSVRLVETARKVATK